MKIGNKQIGRNLKRTHSSFNPFENSIESYNFFSKAANKHNNDTVREKAASTKKNINDGSCTQDKCASNNLYQVNQQDNINYYYCTERKNISRNASLTPRGATQRNLLDEGDISNVNVSGDKFFNNSCSQNIWLKILKTKWLNYN